jgi:hypothetical protein
MIIGVGLEEGVTSRLGGDAGTCAAHGHENASRVTTVSGWDKVFIIL